MRRIITIKLTREEADALIDVGNRGVADLEDAGGDDDLTVAELADAILYRIGAAYTAAWPKPFPTP